MVQETSAEPVWDEAAQRRAYVAYYGDEFGGSAKLAFDIHTESSEAEGRRPRDRVAYEPLPRFSKDQALSAVLSQKAEKAILPITDPSGAFDTEVLELISKMPGLSMSDEVVAHDPFCLAIPTLQYEEQIQSGFPGASPFPTAQDFWRRPATNKLSRDQQIAAARRIDVIYATAADEARCALELSRFRSAGVEIRRPHGDGDAYREVLRAARASLDPDRQVKTRFEEGKGPVVTSTAKASALNTPVYAALMPFGLAHSTDYICVKTDLDDKAESDVSRFVVVKKNPKPKDKSALEMVSEWFDSLVTPSYVGRASALDKKLRDIDDDIAPEPNDRAYGVRLWVRFDGRGVKKSQFGRMLSLLDKQHVVYTPIYLREEEDDVQPIVLQIDLPAFVYARRRPVLEGLMRILMRDASANKPRILGFYESSLKPAKLWMNDKGKVKRRLHAII